MKVFGKEPEYFALEGDPIVEQSVSRIKGQMNKKLQEKNIQPGFLEEMKNTNLGKNKIIYHQKLHQQQLQNDDFSENSCDEDQDEVDIKFKPVNAKVEFS